MTDDDGERELVAACEEAISSRRLRFVHRTFWFAQAVTAAIDVFGHHMPKQLLGALMVYTMYVLPERLSRKRA